MENGVIILEDEAVLLDNRFYLVGRQDLSEPSRASISQLSKALDPEKYAIVLDHQPGDYAAEAESGVDLVLSGHTHGGQLIPINYVGKWLGINDQTYGYAWRNHTDFIVNSGIGDWELFFKTGCKSEYVVIDIR